MNRHYKTLELDKILKLLAEQTSIDDAKEMALSLEPQFELEKVKKLLKQTDDAVVLSGNTEHRHSAVQKLCKCITQSRGGRLSFYRRAFADCRNIENYPFRKGMALKICVNRNHT